MHGPMNVFFVFMKLLRVPRAATTLLEGRMLANPDLCHYQ